MTDEAKLIVREDWKKEVLTFPSYFKSKNYLLGNNPKEQDYLAWVHKRRSVDLTAAFKVDSVSIGNGIYILVADLGLTVLEPTCQARDLKFSQLTEKYLSFMERIIEFQGKSRLYHGDIHVGNVTYWQDRFMLIDYDEARIGEVMPRKPLTDKQKRQYPAALVDEPEMYTKHQLMMTLHGILEQYKRGYEEDEYSSVWDFFESYPGPGKEKPGIVGTKYETLVGLLEKCGRNGKCNYRPMGESFITASPLTTLSSTADSSVRDVNAIGEDDRKRRSAARILEALRGRRKIPRTVESASHPVVVTAAPGTPVPPAVELKPASVDEMVTGSAVEARVAEAGGAPEMKTDEADALRPVKARQS